MLWYLDEFVSISKMPGWVGWDGKGRDGDALLASAGQLVAPLGLLFALLFITWGVLVPS